jgi:hypothetical protein
MIPLGGGYYLEPQTPLAQPFVIDYYIAHKGDFMYPEIRSDEDCDTPNVRSFCSQGPANESILAPTNLDALFLTGPDQSGTGEAPFWLELDATDGDQIDFKFLRYSSGDWVGVPAAAAPEPDSWALTIFGVGLVGAVLRRRLVIGIAS